MNKDCPAIHLHKKRDSATTSSFVLHVQLLEVKQSIPTPSKKAMDLSSPAAGSPLHTEASDVDALPEYQIVNFQCGVTTESELTILCYGKRFHLHVSAEKLHGNPQLEKEYLRKLRKLETEDGLVPIEYNDYQKALVEN
jgi:hypothetical protein